MEPQRRPNATLRGDQASRALECAGRCGNRENVDAATFALPRHGLGIWIEVEVTVQVDHGHGMLSQYARSSSRPRRTTST